MSTIMSVCPTDTETERVSLNTPAVVILKVLNVEEKNATKTAESLRRNTHRMSTDCTLITLLTSDLLHWDISWVNATNNTTGKL